MEANDIIDVGIVVIVVREILPPQERNRRPSGWGGRTDTDGRRGGVTLELG